MNLFRFAGRVVLGRTRSALPVFYFLLLLAGGACRRMSPEDIELPYGRKKYELSLWTRDVVLTDTSGQVRVVEKKASRKDLSPSCLFYHVWDDTCGLKQEWSFLAPYLWLQSPSFTAERHYWEEKQLSAVAGYLESFRLGEPYAPVPMSLMKSSYYEIPGLLHRRRVLERGQDSTVIHLYYKEKAVSRILGPAVLVPFDSGLETYAPAKDFFDKGGILAVVGEGRVKVSPDSSFYYAVADSLYARIFEDSAYSRYRRRLYEEFLADSIRGDSLVQVKKEVVYPYQIKEALVHTAHFLIAGMYSTPSCLGLLSVGIPAVEAEVALFENPDLFGSAVLKIPVSAELEKVWKILPSCWHDSVSFPSTLLFADSCQYSLVACCQQKIQRRCGPHPFLADTGFRAEKAWKFLLYGIDRESGLIKEH